MSVYKSMDGRQQILGQYQQILSFWPAPSEFHHIDTEFGDTFVIESGSKEGLPLLLLHGSASNSSMWLGDAAVLGQTHRVFAVDIIGEPGNSAECRLHLNNGQHARWIQQVLDGLKVGKAVVVGNSFGGWIALDLAAHAPERVNALILLASSGLYPFRRSFALKRLTNQIFTSQNNTGHTLIANAGIPDAVLAYFTLIHREFIPRPLHAPVFGSKALAGLRMPVLYIGGKLDTLLNTTKSAARLKRLVPHADVRVLPDTGHTVINQANNICAFLSTQEV